jgi:hypothetical protein
MTRTTEYQVWIWRRHGSRGSTGGWLKGSEKYTHEADAIEKAKDFAAVTERPEDVVVFARGEIVWNARFGYARG